MAPINEATVAFAYQNNIQSLRDFVKVVGTSSYTLQQHALAFIIYASYVDEKSIELKKEVQRLFNLNKLIQESKDV